MKKTLLSICFLFVAAFGFSQSLALELEHNPVNVMEPDNTKTDIIGETMVKNTGASDLTTTWAFRSTNIPESWVIYVCDPVNCYSPATLTSSFLLTPSQSGMFACHLNPNAVCGTGEVKISFSESSDLKQEGIFNYTVCTTANGDIVTQSINLFPNPTYGTFSIDVENVELGRIDIFNILGRKVQSFDGSTRFFDISDQARGVYLVQMVGVNNEIVKTLRVNKTNP